MTCKYCGHQSANEIILGDDGKVAAVCPSCSKLLYTCITCNYRNVPCTFALYNGPKPKVVVKQIQQGPMVSRVQVMNPELEEELCGKCVCKGHGQGCPKLTNSISIDFYCESHKFDF